MAMALSDLTGRLADQRAQLRERMQQALAGVAGRGLRLRGRWVNRLLTTIYGQPMQVLPKGHAGLAGAVVFWYLQDGFKQFIMVRAPDGSREPDQRTRFVSCLGLGSHTNLTNALKTVLENQLGKVFVKTLGDQVLAADRVSGAPVFTYTDAALGISCPVQALVWVVQVQPAQAELIDSQVAEKNGVQVVMVPEFALNSQKVSATHRALWQAVQRHIPKGRLKDGSVTDEALVEESIKDISGGNRGSRVLH